MIPFSTTQRDQKGAFALAVILTTGDIGIVGQPPPIRAILRIDANPPMECRMTESCLFPRDQSLVAIDRLSTASVLLIDVFTEKQVYKFSLSARGYQAGLAQVRAWRIR